MKFSILYLWHCKDTKKHLQKQNMHQVESQVSMIISFTRSCDSLITPVKNSLINKKITKYSNLITPVTLVVVTQPN